MKQTINNACGTIGLIHAIANNRDKMNFGKFCWLVDWGFLLAFPFFFLNCGGGMEGRIRFVLLSLNITIHKGQVSVQRAFLLIIIKTVFHTNP